MLQSLIFSSYYIPFYLKLIIFFTFLISVIFALTMHEFAHAFVAFKLGDKTPKQFGRLTLNPMAHFDTLGLLCFLFLGFGWAKPVPINPFNFKKFKRDTFFVSIAGIVVNFLLAFIFFPLTILMSMNDSSSIILLMLRYLFVYCYDINLIFMVFNLLPIYPLDGFNAIASQLRYNNPFVNFMHRYGIIVLLCVVFLFSFTNLFDSLIYYVGYPISKFWYLIFFGF